MLYRLYSLGKDGLLFGLPEILEASDDKEAIEKATQCADGLYLEVWDRRRRIVAIPAKEK
jgi:hypothetical protein